MVGARKVARTGGSVAILVATAFGAQWGAVRATAPKPFVSSTLLVVRYDSRGYGSPASGVLLALHARTRRILSHRISLGDPAVSPNQRLIAFGSTDGLYLMKRDGSDLHRISASPGPSPCGNDDVIVWSPMWSADATMLSFNAQNGSDAIERCPPGVTDIFGTWVYDRSAKSAAPLMDPSHVPWSAVGHAFLTDTSSGNTITIIDAAAGRRYVLARNSVPMFSPHRRSLVFDTINANGTSSLWRSDDRGDPPVRVSRVHGYFWEEAWSPDGHNLALDIATRANASGTQFQRLVVFSTVRHRFHPLTKKMIGLSDLTWSPNGKQIAYITTTNPATLTGGPYGVWTINATGGAATQVLTTEHSEDPFKSFDGLVWF